MSEKDTFEFRKLPRAKVLGVYNYYYGQKAFEVSKDKPGMIVVNIPPQGELKRRELGHVRLEEVSDISKIEEYLYF